MKTLKYLYLFLAAVVLLSSCQESTLPLGDDTVDMADDEVFSEAVFDDIFNSSDNAVQMLDLYYIKNGEAKSDLVVVLADSCPVVTVDLSTENSRTVTIDYGDGCEGIDGNTRSGMIIIEVYGHLREEGSSRTVSLDNYYYNDIKVEGIRTTTNMGANENENIVFMTTLAGGKLIFPDQLVVEREVTRYREWVAGFDTRYIWDDEWLITGDASGVGYKGVSYNNTITTPLHRKRTCRFFVSGVIEIARSDMEPFELDFGDGECDAIAVVRRGDEEKEINLRPVHRLLRVN